MFSLKFYSLNLKSIFFPLLSLVLAYLSQSDTTISYSTSVNTCVLVDSLTTSVKTTQKNTNLISMSKFQLSNQF